MNGILIEKAKYVDDLTVNLLFSDGTNRDVDFARFLKTHPHPQHNKYIKYSNFKKFYLENGNIVWGKNSDLIFNIENLYHNKLPVKRGF